MWIIRCWSLKVNIYFKIIIFHIKINFFHRHFVRQCWILATRLTLIGNPWKRIILWLIAWMHFPEHPEINEIFLFSKTSALDLLSINQPESWPDFEHNWICIHEIFFGFIFQSVWVMPGNLPIECHKHSIIVIDVKNPKMAVFESSPRRRLKLLKNCIFGLLRPKFLFSSKCLLTAMLAIAQYFQRIY